MKKERPELLDGYSRAFSVPNGNQQYAMIKLNLNLDENGKPYEVFFDVKDHYLFEHLNALGIMISRLLQQGVHLSDITEMLSGIPSPHTNHTIPRIGIYCPSVYARIGYEIEQILTVMRGYSPTQETLKI